LLTLTKVNLPWISGKNLYCNILKIQPNGSKIFFPFRSTLRKLGNLVVNWAIERWKQNLSFPWLSHSRSVEEKIPNVLGLENASFFSSSDFLSPLTHTKMLCLFVWRHALGALSESERDELYLFLSLDGSTRC